MLDLALEIYLRGFFRYALVATVLFVPERISQVFFGEHRFAKAMERNDPDEILSAILLYMVPILFAYLLNFVALALIARMAYSDFTGRSESLWDSLSHLLRHLPGYIVICTVVFLANVVGVLFCWVGVLFTMWRLYLVQYVYILEDATLGESFRRGWQLSRGSFGRCLGLAVVGYFIASPWGSLAGIPYASFARDAMLETLGLPVGVFELLFVPLTALLLGVAVAYVAVLSVIYYSDQRSRLEGQDLDLMLDRLEAGASNVEVEPAT
jgi:hypothetical protein